EGGAARPAFAELLAELQPQRVAVLSARLTGWAGGDGGSPPIVTRSGARQRGHAALRRRGVHAPELGAELYEILGEGERRRARERVEQRGGGLGLGFGGAPQAPEHGGGDAGIALEERARHEVERELQGSLRVDRDAGDQRGGGAAPLGGREARRERPL